MKLTNLTLLTVTFNNTLLTGMMLKSFQKQVNALPSVIVIDNGNTIPVDEQFKSCFTVVDNFNQKITGNFNQCSKNHCSTIDYALKHLIKTKWCLLVDNDILFKPELKQFLYNLNDDEFDCCGEIGWDDAPPERLYPYFCIINVEKFKNDKLNYFDNNRCIGPDSKEIGRRGPGTTCWYKDTGCSFLEDIKDTWKIKTIKLNNFIVHLKVTGQANRNFTQFLNTNKALFM